jgi:hypothetical protein
LKRVSLDAENKPQFCVNARSLYLKTNSVKLIVTKVQHILATDYAACWQHETMEDAYEKQNRNDFILDFLKILVGSVEVLNFCTSFAQNKRIMEGHVC